jgi:nucleotide-binding universal stress UspA family protein
MKILLAVDGSTYSDDAIDEVARRPWPADSEVKILSSIDPPYMPSAEPWAIPVSYVGELEKAARERTEAIVGSALKRLQNALDPAIKVTTETPLGWAKREILNAAESWKADLIVLGSHGYGAWERFLLGSVSSAVANHAPCSVEIVRRPHAKRETKR